MRRRRSLICDQNTHEVEKDTNKGGRGGGREAAAVGVSGMTFGAAQQDRHAATRLQQPVVRLQRDCDTTATRLQHDCNTPATRLQQAALRQAGSGKIDRCL